MDRVYRSYKITITNPAGIQVTIEPPISVNFQITRNTLASANKCSLTVYNLAQSTRNTLRKDRYNLAEYWKIEIKSGYIGTQPHYGFVPFELPLVFQGNIYECSSYRKRHTFETNFDCFDGGFGIQNGFTSASFGANTDFKTMIQTAISNMPNLINGIMSPEITSKTSTRGQVLFGPSYDVLNQLTGGSHFIDCEKVNVLTGAEVKAGGAVVLDASMLKATPKRHDALLDCECLFFPEAEPGIICSLNSQESIYNGQYAIMGFAHNVAIQSDMCGDATTTISLQYGAQGLKQVAA
jgi:hypothetical protein